MDMCIDRVITMADLQLPRDTRSANPSMPSALALPCQISSVTWTGREIHRVRGATVVRIIRAALCGVPCAT